MKIQIKRQAGATLIEMILVIGLIAIMTVLSFAEKQLEMDQRRAKQVGSQLFMYNNAVRNWISVNTGTTPLDVTYSGTGWLKPTSCGGTSVRPEGFVNCEFMDASIANPINFSSISLSTRIVRTYSPTDGVKITATTTTTPYLIPGRAGNEIRADLSGLAALTAASGSMGMDDPTPATSDASFKSDPLTSIMTIVSSNRADKDAWLRTDGSNTMNNNLRFMSSLAAELRQVIGTSRIESNSDEVLYIGNQGNSSTMPVNGGGSAALVATGAGRESVVIDANARIYGSLVTNKGIRALSGNIEAASGSVIASANVEAGVDVLAARDVTAQRNMTAQRFYDLDNTNFYVDPYSKSLLNEIAANSLESLTPASDLRIKTNRLNFNAQTAADTKFTGQVDVDQFKVKKNGKYIPLSDLLPNFVFKEGWVASNNNLVPKPLCATGGTPKVFVVPQIIPTNTATPLAGYSALPVGQTFFRAIDLSAAHWQVQATALFTSGTPAIAIVQTYCLY